MTTKKNATKAANGRGHLQREAYNYLREMIIHEDLVPGERVSERELSKLTGYGRSPIRHALGRLASDGLVEIVPQSGVIVTDVDLDTHLKILEVRAELERLLVKLAAERASTRQRARIHKLAREMRKVTNRKNPLQFVELLRKTHEVLLEAAANEILDGVMDRIFTLSRRFWYAHRQDYVGLRQAAALHANRLRHIADGNVAQAASACDELISHLNEFVIKILVEDGNAIAAPSTLRRMTESAAKQPIHTCRGEAPWRTR